MMKMDLFCLSKRTTLLNKSVFIIIIITSEDRKQNKIKNGARGLHLEVGHRRGVALLRVHPLLRRVQQRACRPPY